MVVKGVVKVLDSTVYELRRVKKRLGDGGGGLNLVREIPTPINPVIAWMNFIFLRRGRV